MYPRPEKPFEFKITKDVTGMTEAQKVALQRAWQMYVLKDMAVHSKNIFLLFFKQNPNYMKYFDFEKVGLNPDLSDNQSLQAHAINAVTAVSTIIMIGLRDPPLFEHSLGRIVKNHQMRGIRQSDIQNMLGSFKTYMMSVTENDNIEFFEEALDSLFNRITQGFDIVNKF